MQQEDCFRSVSAGRVFGETDESQIARKKRTPARRDGTLKDIVFRTSENQSGT